jgi:hypothetical protein
MFEEGPLDVAHVADERSQTGDHFDQPPLASILVDCQLVDPFPAVLVTSLLARDVAHTRLIKLEYLLLVHQIRLPHRIKCRSHRNGR